MKRTLIAAALAAPLTAQAWTVCPGRIAVTWPCWWPSWAPIVFEEPVTAGAFSSAGLSLGGGVDGPTGPSGGDGGAPGPSAAPGGPSGDTGGDTAGPSGDPGPGPDGSEGGDTGSACR